MIIVCRDQKYHLVQLGKYEKKRPSHIDLRRPLLLIAFIYELFNNTDPFGVGAVTYIHS